MKANLKQVDYRSVKLTLPDGHKLATLLYPGNTVSEVTFLVFSIPGNVYAQLESENKDGKKVINIFSAHQHLKIKQMSAPILRFDIEDPKENPFIDFIRSEYKKSYALAK